MYVIDPHDYASPPEEWTHLVVAMVNYSISISRLGYDGLGFDEKKFYDIIMSTFNVLKFG